MCRYLLFLLFIPFTSAIAVHNNNDYLFYCHAEQSKEIKAKTLNNHLVVYIDSLEIVSNETIEEIKSVYKKELAEVKKEGADDYAMFRFSTENDVVSIGSGIDKADYSDATNRLSITNKNDDSSKTYWCDSDDLNQLDLMKESAD